MWCASLRDFAPGGLVHTHSVKRCLIACATALIFGAVGTLDACRQQNSDMRDVVPGGNMTRGVATITTYQCGACHEISGVTNAHGQIGPPLDGIAHRTILAGRLPNTPDNLVRWIRDPQSVDSGTAMPKLGVTEQQARDIAAYLYAQR